MKMPEFPKEIKRGSVSVTIYETPSKGYANYTLAYYQDGRRKREYSADYSAILNRAGEVLTDLNDGRPTQAGLLKTAERTEFVRAKNLLKSKGIPLPLDVVVRHYAEAYKILGNDFVIETAREYAKRHPQKLPQKSAAEVVDEFIESKRAKGVSQRYMEDLVYRLGQFKGSVQSNISHIDADKIRIFLDGLTKADGEKVSARSYNNFRLAIITLFEFAKKRKYLPTDWNEFDSVDKLNDKGGPIEIFTSAEISKLLAVASPDMIPFLSLGAFGGLRSAEIERLDWRDVKFETGFVIIEAAKAKTASRRQVEMHPNLRVWLQPHAKKDGPVYPYNDDWLYKTLREVSATAKVPWKNNVLRHSYISYRIAETGDVNRTALEAGNSPAMIFSNYRELVTPQEAKTWFSIMPPKRKSVRKIAKNKCRVIASSTTS
jgi:integrase